MHTFSHRMRDKRGMAGLTDQFPISPSRPAVIRSSCTWREAWIPLGFINSNYPMLFSHSPIFYFSSGSWHCPLLPPSASPPQFLPVVLHSVTPSFIPPPKSPGWLIHGLQSFCLYLSLFGHFPHVNPSIPAEGLIHSFTHTHTYLSSTFREPVDEKAIAVTLE